jgi:hypothetical protein
MHDDDEYAELFKPRKPSSGASWDDVAREFRIMGSTLGDAMRSVWQRQDGGERLRELQDSLAAMLDQVNRTTEDHVGADELNVARAQLTRLVESIRTALDQTSEELRPELLALLRQANAELRRLTRQND